MSSGRSPTASIDSGSVTSHRDERDIACVVRQVAFGDVGDDDLLVAIGQQFRRQMPADEAVAAENDVFHRSAQISLLLRTRLSDGCSRQADAMAPLWAMRMVPTQMKPMPAMRQAFRSSWKTK